MGNQYMTANILWFKLWVDYLWIDWLTDWYIDFNPSIHPYFWGNGDLLPQLENGTSEIISKAKYDLITEEHITAVKIYMIYNFQHLYKPLHILYFPNILLTNKSLEVSIF